MAIKKIKTLKNFFFQDTVILGHGNFGTRCFWDTVFWDTIILGHDNFGTR
ncbi:MAG: hypothetical protein ACTSRG_20170 [Candidatus Helarchaeota archaeon]